MTDRISEMRARRDEKARPHLEQYAPVWIVEEQVLEDEDAIRFDVVFYHPRYGWVNRRYRFDAFNSVLYYLGQTPIPEADAVAIEERDPYIAAAVINTVDSYGG